MTFTVYCFNDGLQLASILNGVTHFLGSDSWTTLAALMLCILFVMSILRFQKVDVITYMRNMYMPFLLYLVFFVPPCKLNLTDQFSGEVYTVSSVPMGVAGPLWASGLIERAFIDIIDQYVAPPASPKMKEIDYFGHARLMAEVSTTNLWSDPYLNQTIIEYFENCVLHMLANGQISAQALRRSENLLQSFASTSQSLFTPIHTSTGQQVTTCALAYADISGRASAGAASRTADSPYARASQVLGTRALNGVLATASFDAILGSMFNGQQDNMEGLFLQNLFINSTRAGMTQVSPDLQAAMAEAESKHFSSGVTAALLYIKQLPKLRAIFKLLMVALFPVIGAFFLASSGRPFLYWAGTLLWISLWLPASAAVHAAFIAETVSDLRAVTWTNGGYSLATNAPIVKWATETAVLAGGVMLIVPVLTGMLIRWAFPMVGTTISGMLQGARGLERQVLSASVGSVQAAGQKVLGLEKDAFARATLDAGDRNTSMRMYSKELLDSYGHMYQSAYGQRPATYSISEQIGRGVGQFTMSSSATTRDLSAAQASLTSARQDQETWSRAAMGMGALQQIRSGSTIDSDSITSTFTDSQKEDFSKMTSGIYQQLVKEGYETKHGRQATVEAAKVAAIDAAIRMGDRPFKGLPTREGIDKPTELARQLLTKVNVQAGGTYNDSLKEAESASKGKGAKLDTGSGFTTQESQGTSRVNSKAFAEAAATAIVKSLATIDSENLGYSDVLQKANASRQSFEARKARVDSLENAIAEGGNMQVNTREVFGLLANERAVMNFMTYNDEAYKNFNATGSHVSAAQRGYIDFTNTYGKAMSSGNPEDWAKTFRTIEGLKYAHLSQGNQAGYAGAQKMQEIAEQQYLTKAKSEGGLPDVEFELIKGQGVGYMGSDGSWKDVELGKWNTGVEPIDKLRDDRGNQVPDKQGPAPDMDPARKIRVLNMDGVPENIQERARNNDPQAIRMIVGFNQFKAEQEKIRPFGPEMNHRTITDFALESQGSIWAKFVQQADQHIKNDEAEVKEKSLIGAIHKKADDLVKAVQDRNKGKD